MPGVRRRGRRGAVLGLLAVAGVAIVGALPGCAAPGDRTIEVSKERLQELIGRAFPVRRRVLELLELGIDAPRLALQPERNRIALDFAVGLAGLPGSPGIAGTLRVSHALRYEASDRTVRAVDVDVERLDLGGVPASLQQRLDRVGRPLAAALLEGRVLHTLRAQDAAAFEARGLQPQLRVTPAGLEIRFAH